jgi:hypothetical protein
MPPASRVMCAARRISAAVALALAPALLGAAVAAPAVPPAAAAAQPSTVLYRCTSGSGAVALQDEPCPPGQTQERREIAAFSPAPPAAAPTMRESAEGNAPGAAPAPAITVSDAPIAAPKPLMPPPLWRCTDPNGGSRLSEVYDPQPRCVPLSMLGVDLSRAPPSAAALCRTVEDECVELGGDAACAAWEERLSAAESSLRHAFSDDAPALRRERDRAKAVVANDCRP